MLAVMATKLRGILDLHCFEWAAVKWDLISPKCNDNCFIVVSSCVNT